MYRLLTVIVVLLFMSDLNGQTGNTPGEILRQKLKNYCEAVPREEIYLHSDRDEYISGEDFWFKIYLIDRQTSAVTSSSSVVYVELINSDSRPVVRKRITLNNGLGPGYFVLPDTLSTGRYIIKAYTNWMKNFMPNNCFVREINIYNALSSRSLRGKPGFNEYSSLISVSNDKAYEPDPGIDLKVIRKGNAETNISIASANGFLSPGDDICFLLIQTHGIVDLIKTIKLQAGEVNTYVPDSLLTPGINQVVIFNSALKPLFEKYLYTPDKESEDLNLHFADTIYRRQKVSLTFNQLKDGSELLDSCNFSTSIIPGNGKMRIAGITDYMVFATEFGILPESIRNNRLSDIPADTIDRFLKSAKSNWIDWDMVISGTLPSIKYLMEKDFHYLTGRFIDKMTRMPLPGKVLFLSMPGKMATFQYSRTDSAGLFSFTLPVTSDARDLIIQPEDADKGGAILINTGFTEDYVQRDSKVDTSILIGPDYISKWGVNYQVARIYGIDYKKDIDDSPLLLMHPKRFYGTPDIELIMDHYVLLPLMEEVFFELTPGIQLKRKKNSYSMTVADPVTNRIYEKPPVLFIDGVVINDPAIIAGLDPENVEKIDAIRNLYMVGDYMFFGIVNVITKTGDFRGVTLPDYAVRLKYRVIEPCKSFFTPDYSSSDLQKSRIPDFRNTLYWNPSVSNNSERKPFVEFWTSDITGAFEINIQGTNSKGKPVSFSKVITVK
ncbi:MAG TPA: hypothetical protein VMV47_14740 [Bacteroidales bacterium]|nr:hypothetical protein [Bacteroidales bacterium]